METSAQAVHTVSHVLYGSQISVEAECRTVVPAVIPQCLTGTNVLEEYIAPVFRVELHNTAS